MSGISDTATVTLNVNGIQAKKALAEMQAKIKDTEDAINKLKASGNPDPKKLSKLQKELTKLKRQFDDNISATQGAEKALRNLDKATPRQLDKAIKALNRQLKDMVPGSEVWNEHIEKIKILKAQLKLLRGEIDGQETIWQKFSKWWYNSGQAVAALIAGYSTAISTLRSFVNDYASMDQEMANVRKYTGMAESQVVSLNKEFQNIDTRSSREELNKLAQEAGRLGKTSQEDVLGFVRAADKINVALDDLGDGATLTLSKLTGIFGDEARYGTEQSLLKVGSVINELSQNCSASAPYLAEFSSRLGGVGSQAGMTIQQIMGFGAVLDSNAQKVEASSTALSQVIVRLYQEPEKYAKVAGLNVKEFSKLMREDANGAIILFLETLQKAGGMDVLSPMFKDMGETGARAITALSTLAAHIDQVKAQQEVANRAFKEGISIDQEFAVQNDTVQAALEKCKNRANELRVELGGYLYPLMKHFITSSSAVIQGVLETIRFLITYKTEVAAIAGSILMYNVAIVAHNLLLDITAVKTAIVTKATLAWQLVSSKLSGVLAVGRVAVAAMTNAIQYLTNGFNYNYAMQQRWKKAMAGMSFASWTGLILALGSALFLVYRHLKKLEEERRVVEKIRAEAIKKTGEERVAIDLLVAAANNENLSLDERKKAIDKLNSIIPNYNGLLDETTGKYTASKKALDDYIASLTRKYELEGARSKLASIGEEKADATVELNEAQKQYDRAKAAHENGVGRYYTTSWGSVGNTAADALASAERVLASANARLEEIKKREKAILDSFGEDLQKEEANGTSESASDISVPTPENGPLIYVSEKQAEKEREKSELEAKRELAKAKAEYKQQMEAAKGDWEAGNADNIWAYSSGEKSYTDFLARKEELDLQYVNARIAVYEKLYEGESAEEQKLLKLYDEDYQELLMKKADLSAKASQAESKRKVEDLEREYKMEVAKADFEHNSIMGKTFGDEEAYQEKLHQLKVEYLTKYKSCYKVDSKEWIEYERQIQETEQSRMLEKRKALAQKFEEWQNSYTDISAKRRLDIESKLVGELYAKKRISEEEYQLWLANLRKKYGEEASSSADNRSKSKYTVAGPGGDVDIRSGSAKTKAAATALAGKRDSAIEELKARLNGGLITQEEYDQGVAQIEKAYRKNLFDPVRDMLDDQTRMLLDLGLAWADFFSGMRETGKLSFEDIASVASATVATMCAGLQIYSQFLSAQKDIELARVEKVYDREVELAQGNSYKVAKAEKKKEEQTQKIKAEYSKKEFSVKILTAIANTAQNAIMAYGSLASIPVVGPALGAAAAAAATALGMVQVALIKKQQQAAEAQGYAEGGFTKKGRKYEPAGIVHAGEWVASQELLASPVARPLIEHLDYVQRTNTIGSLRAEDVSRSITASDSLVRMAETDDGSSLMAAVASEMSRTVADLTARLREPFVTVNTVSGDQGIKKALDEYSRMISNKSPKTK